MSSTPWMLCSRWPLAWFLLSRWEFLMSCSSDFWGLHVWEATSICIVFHRVRRAYFGSARLARDSANPLLLSQSTVLKKNNQKSTFVCCSGEERSFCCPYLSAFISWPLLISIDAHKTYFILFQINKDAMERALSSDMLATDLANYLVRKGVSIQTLGRREGNEKYLCSTLRFPLSSAFLFNCCLSPASLNVLSLGKSCGSIAEYLLCMQKLPNLISGSISK